jgi:hypothetical protein
MVASPSQVAVINVVHDDGLVASGKQMPTQSVTGVEPRRKDSEHPLHAFDQRRFRRLDDKVKVVAHQTKGVDLLAGKGSSFSQGLDEPLAVAVVQDDMLPAISSAEHVVACPFVLHSQRPWHDPGNTNTACQSVNFPLIRSDTFYLLF